MTVPVDVPPVAPRSIPVGWGRQVRRAAARAVHLLERQEWLDAPSYKLEHATGFLFNLAGARARSTQDLLHGVWLGHPLHPTLTDIPLGAWSTAFVLDTVDLLVPRPPGLRRAAQLAVGLGVLGGVAAAVTGVTDWQHTHDDARRLGMVHGAGNTMALALYGMSWRDRRRGHLARARVASSVGYAVAVIGSYLGGALVFRHRVGVDHGDARLTPRTFTAVLAQADLCEDTPTLVDCAGVAVVLLRHDGRITALGGDCPHLGAPMAQGWLYRGALVCPWHGSRFDPQTGAVVTGPATSPLACFQTRLREGHIEIRRVPPAQPAATPTRTPTATGPVDAGIGPTR